MITDDSMNLLFQALSNETRRHILDLLIAKQGQTVGELASQFDVSRIAIMNHLRVLENADLVISQKDGRSRRLYLNVMPIQMVYDRWTDAYSSHWANKLTRLKYATENATQVKEKS